MSDALADTGVAGRPKEYFNRWHIPSWPERLGAQSDEQYIAAVLREGSTPNGVFGGKLFWMHLTDTLSPLLHRLSCDASRSDVALLSTYFPKLHYIYIRRHDRVRQAVSWEKVNQTSVWDEGFDQPSEPAPSLRFNFHAIDTLVNKIEWQESEWDRIFREGGITPLEIVYEELSESPVATVHRVLDFLCIEMPDHFSFVPRLRKQADHISEEWVQLYEAMRSGANVVYSDAATESIESSPLAQPQEAIRRRWPTRTIFGLRRRH